MPHGTFAAAGEERWLTLAARDEDEWRGLCGAIGRDDWAADASLASPEQRRARAAEIDAAIAGWCRDRDRDAAAEALAAAGVPASPILELEERNEHPHFAARGLSLQHEFEDFDPCRIYATPWLLSETPAALTRKTPALGENNDYVYRDLLGLAEDEIERLKEEGVLV